MTTRIAAAGLQVAPELHAFVNDEALPGTSVSAARFWRGLAALVRDLGPRTRDLLRTRDALQAQIDDWHRARPGAPDPVAYKAFLRRIGYLAPEPAACEITTAGVDREIAAVAGPQLVVPLTNPRFVLNAANARWGSLYDALYGTDALGEPKPHGPYDAARGRKVIDRARELLDQIAPLDGR